MPGVAEPVVPTDGMVIRQDTILAPGVYILPNGLRVASDGVTVDGNGAVLVGVDRRGRGVTVEQQEGVTIERLHVLGYYHGIYARACRRLAVRHCRITATAEVPPNQTFLDIWRPVEAAYGGAILLEQVEDGEISHNDLQHQMCGLLTYGCHRLLAQGNNASYCSGFGFHLSGTTDSLFEGNHADYCCRYEERGERQGHMGADAAGFLGVRGASGNVFRRNMARLGGDGFFFAGLSPDGVLNGCDDNLFEANDASFSPNIAFEATFCRANTYRDNLANAGNYGFWCGFSRDFVLKGNQIQDNGRAGIAVENGFRFLVGGNTIRRNRHGILLWSRYVPDFAAAVPQNSTSYQWLIEGNTLRDNGSAIRIAADQDHGVAPWKKAGATPPPHDHIIRRNVIEGNRLGIELEQVEGTVIEANRTKGNLLGDVRRIEAEAAGAG